ncbi:tautomerase family protein [Vannielia litorea]|uniref:tautomerase family protein n=1 Tax=Vannielia litorea TaxID=1217970 RepID=UPI001C95C6A5|nr:tautomerase family protein [Vannielia litorea]MBY6048400.1 tautomerase family protein [Vannielia litorea]MBY6075814.1 tautomerase family protein [Vannielia litorea]
MPLVDIELIEGVFDDGQKAEMIEKVTDAMVAIEGEAMRGVTWVRVKEVKSGHWGIGGNRPSAADIKAMALAAE